jgi:hypothetical protein
MRLVLLLCVLFSLAVGCSREPPRERGLWDTADRRDVQIDAGDVKLAATLYRPPGAKGDLPAVVLSHGSGPQTRNQNGFWTNLALEAGLAVLVYDKRGTGQSTGEVARWNVNDTPEIVADLASDMKHAARWLAVQPGIRKDEIGLMGGSQAGWVMPLAASQSPVVSFIVIGAGVPLPTGAEDVHSRALSQLGYDDETKAPLKAILAADMATRRSAPYKGYDPADAIESLKIPVLWIFGLHDGVIPTRQSIQRIENLRASGHSNHEMHIFEDGNHDFKNVSTGEPYNVATVVSDWLSRVGVGEPRD